MSLLSTHRLIELMEQLQRAADERHTEERRIASVRVRGLKEADSRRDKRRRDVEQAHRAEREGIDSDAEGRHAMLAASYEASRSRTQDEYKNRRTTAEADAAKAIKRAGIEKKEAGWEVHTLYDAARKKPPEKLKEFRKRLASLRSDLETIATEAVQIAKGRGHGAASFVPPPMPAEASDADPANEATDVPAATETVDDAACESAETTANQAIDAAQQSAQSLYDQWLPRMLAGPIPAGAFVGMLSVALPMAGLSLGWTDWRAYAIGFASAAVTSAIAFFAPRPAARKQTIQAFEEASVRLRTAHEALAEAAQLAERRAECELEALKRRRDSDLEEIAERAKRVVAEAKAARDAELKEISESFPKKLAEMRVTQDESLAELESDNTGAVAELTQRRDERLERIEADHTSDTSTIEEEAETAWQAMFERWLTSYDDVRAELRDMRSECQRLFPDFAVTDYPASDEENESTAWTLPADPPSAIAFGRTAIDLEQIDHGLSEDERLHPPELRLETPALMNLAEHPTLLVTAHGEGRRPSVELLRAMMLRFLTAMPPGKVRFTILDPVGLGDNFQAFMHLADEDEQLINGRIWSETRDIEEQLGRLTNHMETVLQKYLRSEYESIHEYNAQAGEVAEPYQVLIAAGFPANFSEAAGRKLVSLVTGGPRCGVYTLLGVDTAARLPTDFRLDELKENAAWLDWDATADGGARFVWRRPALEHLPIELAKEPPNERAIETIKRAGAAAKAAVKVEVPFSVVEPPRDDMWSSECGSELSVPIGRAGAKNLQHVRLGKGTSQHLLVAGKTGSGKSTFLHALVTSAAMHFSPDEVEFYLVDFKKGVEFKSYATHRLPHARVIAIESEREFGLSVLERLDEELRVRGERFRDAGVQNLADYREKHPEDK
ncbi:MAG: FtsK/SpoIIIE domain-containing protein, partial [Planctomycetota bacterium]